MLKYHIQTVEVGSGGASTIYFSAIPQEYDDLELVVSARSTYNSIDCDLITGNFNSSTSGYDGWRLYGVNGASTGTDGNDGSGTLLDWGPITAAQGTPNSFGSTTVKILNYSSSTEYKFNSSESVSEQNNTKNQMEIYAGVWKNTTPITSITLDLQNGGNFVQYSSASLYGIKHGVDGVVEAAADGGAITQSGGYTIHTFTASGTFVANRDMDVEYVVVAGGGGGGFNLGGGGGGGGYRSSVTGESSGGGASAEPKLRVNSGTSYSIVVGAGGTGAATTILAANGSNSTFGSIVALGGGGGAGENVSPGGAVGGSGGGASYSWTGGAGTAGQGYGGGNPMSPVANPVGGGGGGGAGSVGANAIPGYAGNGGSGVSSSITGFSVARSGGGGGGELYTGTSAGSGGSGVGGAGGFGSGTGSNGTVNTGGGGGGGGQNGGGKAGGAGGSGVVIIRYPTPA